MIGEDSTHPTEEGKTSSIHVGQVGRHSDRNSPHTNLRFVISKGLKIKQLSIEEMTGYNLGQGRKQTITRARVPGIPILEQGLHFFAF